MRLAAKLSLTIFACCAVAIGVAGGLIIRREYDFADGEIAQHGRVLGRAIALSVGETWRRQGEQAVTELLNDISHHDPGVDVHWVALDGAPGPSAPITAAVRARLRRGEIVDHISRDNDDTLYTLVPIVAAQGGAARAVEVAESLRDRDDHIQLLVISIVAAMLGALLSSGGAAFLLGRWLVGRPITALVGKARRVGRGDLSTPVTVAGRDELNDLALELNAMARGLAQAWEQVEREASTRREAEAQLRHAERLATVGKLAAGVAHEMGTPLNVISESARRIGEGDVEHDRHLEAIQRHTTRITGIVHSLLRFSRRKPLTRVRLDLEQMVTRALPLLEGASAPRRVAICTRLQAPRPLVLGDGEQLEQVLTNLVLNGIQAMPRGGEITIGIDRQRPRSPGHHTGPGDLLHLWVEDQGAGIAPDVLPHVFDPFFTTKDVGQGTGLGLSICFGIVKDHGGWIDVQSQLHRGSRFSVYLPELVAATGENATQAQEMEV